MTCFTKKAVRGLVAAVLLGIPATATAQSYPSRDITFIAPFGAGGSTGSMAMQYTAQLEKLLGTNINIQNMPGGAGTIGVGAIVQAEPDGYTIGLAPSEVLTYQPLVHTDLPYETPDDYQPIVKLADRPSVLFVRSDAPWKNFEEFMAEARENPGQVRVAVPGINTLSDLVVQQLNKVSDVDLVSVPFTGSGMAHVIPVLGRRVEATMSSVAASLGQVQSGDLRALAAFQKGPNQVLPEATSVVDAGYDVSLQVSFYVIAPKGLPEDVLDKLVTASLQVVRSDEFLKFSKQYDFVSDVKGPDEIRAELVLLGETFSDLVSSSKAQ